MRREGKKKRRDNARKRRRDNEKKMREDARKMRRDVKRTRGGVKKMKEESKKKPEDRLKKMKKRKTISLEDGTMLLMISNILIISQTISAKTSKTPSIPLRKKSKKQLSLYKNYQPEQSNSGTS